MGEGAIETKADAHAMQLKLPSKMSSRTGAEGRRRDVGLECIAVILSRRVHSHPHVDVAVAGRTRGLDFRAAVALQPSMAFTLL